MGLAGLPILCSDLLPRKKLLSYGQTLTKIGDGNSLSAHELRTLSSSSTMVWRTKWWSCLGERPSLLKYANSKLTTRATWHVASTAPNGSLDVGWRFRASQVPLPKSPPCARSDAREHKGHCSDTKNTDYPRMQLPSNSCAPVNFLLQGMNIIIIFECILCVIIIIF